MLRAIEFRSREAARRFAIVTGWKQKFSALEIFDRGTLQCAKIPEAISPSGCDGQVHPQEILP